MQILLLLLIAAVTAMVTFDFDPGPAPGLNIKNALLYSMALALLLRSTMDRSFRIQLPSIPLAFAALIGYALLSYVVIVVVLDYPRYQPLQNAFYLKNTLFDQMLFFLVFFYGPKSDKDVLLLLSFLLGTWAFGHVIAVLDALGHVEVGDIEQRGDGRVQGAIGESNQYGAFVALSLPAMIAMALVARGLGRFIWLLAAVITAGTLVMTVSRGAYVATALAAIVGLVVFRRYASPGRLALIAVASLAGVVILVSVVAALGFGDLLVYRLVGGTSSLDMSSTSSGRTEIWAGAIEVMFREPLTLITGYGWNAYNAMPFRLAPHNFYLANWFNLGLPGLVLSVMLLYLPVKYVRAAIPAAQRPIRPVLMAFVIGTIALAIATFFVDLYTPWIYYWAYAGLALRLAVNAMERSSPTEPATAQAPQRAAPASDSYGWKGAMRA